MTDPLMDPEQSQFLDSVRSFVDAEIVPKATFMDRTMVMMTEQR